MKQSSCKCCNYRHFPYKNPSKTSLKPPDDNPEMFLLVFPLITISLVAGIDNQCDKLGVLLYQDLGCTPVVQGSEKCPQQYKCPGYNTSSGNCVFQAKNYTPEEEIPENLTYDACNVGCRCHQQTDTKAAISCPVLDCPEWLGYPVEPGCYRTYKLGGCCSTGSKCPPFEDVAKCQVDGKEYREDQRFYPENTCWSCVCKKGFQGKFEEPFCQRMTCSTEIRNTPSLENNCAPVYLHNKETLCCPDIWACPSDKDVVKNTTGKPVEDVQCKWGQKMLNLGDIVDTEVSYYDSKIKKVSCECVLPPFLTCKEK